MPRIEPLEPLKESSTIYDALAVKEEKEQPPPKPAKKPAKKKPKETEKQQAPRSLAYTLLQLEGDEIAQLMAEVELRFPSTPLLWLKDLAAFLNKRLEHTPELPNLAEHPTGFPLSGVSAGVRAQLRAAMSNKALHGLFWEHCLSNLLTDFAKGLPTMGYRLCLQTMASEHPEVVTSRMQKLVELRSKNQQKQPQCLLVLWAACQAGLSDLSKGLAVWMDLLLPVAGVRPYAALVVDYLSNLLERHPSKVAGLGDQGVRQLFAILDLAFGGSLPVSPKQQETLLALYYKFKELSYAGRREKVLHKYFPSYLRRLGGNKRHSSLDAELLSSLVECLSQDEQTYRVWRSTHYQLQLVPSRLLIQHLEHQWQLMPRRSQALLRETLASFALPNPSAKPSAEAEETCRQSQILLKKMSGRGFPWFLVLVTLATAVGTLVVWDMQGSFQRSRTRQLLKDAGLLSHLEPAIAKGAVYWQDGLSWVGTQAPRLYKRACEQFGPTLDAAWVQALASAAWAWDRAAPARDWLCKQGLPLLQWGDEWVPFCAATVLRAAHEAWATVGVGVSWLLTNLVTGAQLTSAWLTQNVLTGAWSPEKLQGHASDLAATFQGYAVEAYRWLHDQVAQSPVAK
uniref:Putative conserved plasma membrane protein n=1 Tax=Ixodes ricinus TaxID=34613 RepID=A0A131XQN2_IXORI